MKSSLFSALTLIVLLTPDVHAGERLVIDLPERVSCGDGVVTLGQIARLSGGDALLQSRVHLLDIADRPNRDQPTVVSRKQVEFRLRLAGIDPGQFQITGAESVSLILQRRSISPEEVIAVARDSLLKRLSWNASEVSVETAVPVVTRLPEVTAGDDVKLIAQPHSATVSLGRMQMDVTVHINGERKLTFPVVFDVRLMQRVAIALKPISAGEVIADSNVRIESRAVDPNRKFILGDEAIGRKARKPISIGKMLASDDIDAATLPVEPVLVKLRQRVSMSVNLGAVRVSAAGEAMQEGKLGQVIRVQNVDSKKIVSARVTGPGTVEVELGGAP